ncbi:GGDEF domain-containing protein [Massilia cavernae]|uniref:diguanylate cyclase n=1 Tax=Massilia cavernae TaxID=2320864 RepID=A0A418Y7D9_9BURK|nr:diguanylate cyclase [Massilia cavernae]RJG25866.1 diguanylate cyclase [Massilia cavernae]
MKILIAEDDASSRLVLGATLRKLGHAVTAVADGRSALAAWQQGEHVLLISDWMMPDMDGLELCRMVRAAPRLQYTYIILLTARSGKGSYLEGMGAGADDLITKPFDAEHLAARLHVAQRILALHETLRFQAMHDHLTGLWNRGMIMGTLQEELARAARDGSCIGVILADLDHFKRINDTYGHLSGDTVLQETARRMHHALRTYDRIGRYGGEEFLIIASGGERSDVHSVAERIRDRVAETPVQTAAGAIIVTVSLGLAITRMGGRDDAVTVIAAADAALYCAKKERNRVHVAEREGPGLPEPPWQ